MNVWGVDGCQCLLQESCIHDFVDQPLEYGHSESIFGILLRLMIELMYTSLSINQRVKIQIYDVSSVPSYAADECLTIRRGSRMLIHKRYLSLLGLLSLSPMTGNLPYGHCHLEVLL